MNDTTELLVIGGGASGLAAAAAASEAGVSTMLVEANAFTGGNGVFPRGMFAVDSVLQRRQLIFADPDRIFSECMAYSHWKINGRIVRRLIDRTGDTIQWLMDMGVPFNRVVHHMPNQSPEVFHVALGDHVSETTGRQVTRALEQRCREHGVKILTRTRGRKLLKDENGAVTGAVCTDAEGRELTIHARQVIIGTGGFAGNKELIHEFLPEIDRKHLTATAGMLHQGDGIRMARAAGADVEGHFTMEIAAPSIHGFGGLKILMGKAWNVWVNRQGRRFADESIVYNFPQSAHACLEQPGSELWVLFDKRIMERTLADGMDIIEYIHIPEGAEEKLPDTIEEAIQAGVMRRADSVEALEQWIGCGSGNLRREIEEYNTCCLQGRDKIFAKDRRYLMPLTEPPFYAIRAGVDLLNTHGGIRVDEEFRALDPSGNVLPGLRVVGVDFGGADADIYNVNLSGHGFSFAVNSGRIAGEHAASELRGSRG